MGSALVSVLQNVSCECAINEKEEGSRHDHHFQLAHEGRHGDTYQASTEPKNSQRTWGGQTPSHLEDEGVLIGCDEEVLCEVGHVAGDTSKVVKHWKEGKRGSLRRPAAGEQECRW